MLGDETGQNSDLRGSNVNGKDLVRLSVGITAIVFVLIPFTMLSFIALVIIFKRGGSNLIVKSPGLLVPL